MKRSVRRNLLWVLLVAGCWIGSIPAAGQAKSLAFCTGEKLDLNLMPEAISAPRPVTAGLLALSIQNRSSIACILPEFTLQLPPDNPEPPLWAALDATDVSDAARLFSKKSRVLAPGDRAHLVIAFSYVPEKSHVNELYDCHVDEGLRFMLAPVPNPAPPWLFEAVNLGIKRCGPVWVSNYRAGEYSRGEPVAPAWMQRFDLRMDDIAQPKPVATADTQNLSLGTYSGNVFYILSSPEIGLWSDFLLQLHGKTPLPRACPFRSIRKREDDGTTLFYFNPCPSIEDSNANSFVNSIDVSLKALRLLPQKTGDVAYDVVSTSSTKAGEIDSEAVFILDVREPSDPTLPPIDTKLGLCKASQLSVSSPVVDLGDHWNHPRNYARDGEAWRDGRAFQVTNTATEGCLLGGMPEVSFANPPEMKDGEIRPEICRDCANDLFRPRGSQWIELEPQQTAHFLAAVTVYDNRYFGRCLVIGGIRLSLPSGSIDLPFDTASCTRVDVSPWRAGRFDADPLNIEYDRQEHQREMQRTAALKPLPQECANEVSEDTGRPIMFPSRGSLQHGLSSHSSRYGKPVPLIEWTLNPTDASVTTMGCGDDGWDWFNDVDVFDASGNRVLDKAEAASWPFKATRQPPFCTLNVPVTIPAHTCWHGAFSTHAYADVRDHYSLSPGEYFLVPAAKAPDGSPASRSMPDSGDALVVKIEPQ